MADHDFLMPLAESYPKRKFKRGMLLIQEGDDHGPLYILLKGRLKAFSYAEDGKEITYGLYSPVDLIGEMSLDGGQRSASVITEEDSECAVLDSEALLSHARDHPEFSVWLIRRVIQRARAATLAARGLALFDVYGRLKHFLETQVFPEETPTAQPRKFTHQEIAHHIGSSREMVSKLMKDLESGGYIEIVDRRVRSCRVLPAKW
jgi:CRP/FNR family transcriptional regulator, cyclic AMP receptor protein